ncbi:hypothetical protein ABT324_30740 [Saccharopolyspora sp. NPDC000359]|uniref:hypothetical protein n=1 Tax=Saccharopolyspora sp. NPDC000359 TaxID=3154251 RepID=UPI003325C3B2
MLSESDRAALARYTLAAQTGKTPTDHETLVGVVSAVDDTEGETQRLLGLPGADEVTAEDLRAALQLVPTERHWVDTAERDLLAALMDRLGTWDAVGEALGQRGDTVRFRYRRLGGEKIWPSGRPTKRRGAAAAE